MKKYILAFTLALIAVFSISAAASLYQAIRLVAELPGEEKIIEKLTEQKFATSEMLDKNGYKIGNLSSMRSYHLRDLEIPQKVKLAFLAAEDKNFYQHNGFDLKGIIRASVTNLLNFGIKQGASTITQQVARMSFLTNERSWNRKIKEAWLSIVIEKKISKQKILQAYINRIYLGNHSYGVEAAARNYFRKTTANLSLAEAAMLAGLPQAPSLYAPHKNYQRALKRQKWVLKQMYNNKWISKKSYLLALKEPLSVQKTPEKLSQNAPYFHSVVQEELEKRLPKILSLKGGLKIHTTLDLHLQRAAKVSLDQSIKSLIKNHKAKRRDLSDLEGAIISIDPRSGAVRSMQGGRRFTQSQFNRTLMMKRRLGSFFMPIYSALSLEKGYTLAHGISDVAGKQARIFKNPLIDAVLHGDTIAGVAHFTKLGNGTVRQFSRRMGVPFERKDLLLGLGYGEASVAQMAMAYSHFANEGKRFIPYVIEKVTDSQGNVLYEKSSPKFSRSMTHSSAHTIHMMLQQYAKRTLGRETVYPQRQDFAMYQGLSDELHNGWQASILPHNTTIVWLGAERGHVQLAEDALGVKKALWRTWDSYQSRWPRKEWLRPSELKTPNNVGIARIRIDGQNRNIPVHQHFLR